MIAGFLCHTAAIIYRAYELQAFPVTHLSESFSFFAALAVPVLLAEFRENPVAVDNLLDRN